MAPSKKLEVFDPGPDGHPYEAKKDKGRGDLRIYWGKGKRNATRFQNEDDHATAVMRIKGDRKFTEPADSATAGHPGTSMNRIIHELLKRRLDRQLKRQRKLKTASRDATAVADGVAWVKAIDSGLTVTAPQPEPPFVTYGSGPSNWGACRNRDYAAEAAARAQQATEQLYLATDVAAELVVVRQKNE
jgi:hypothetical protein